MLSKGNIFNKLGEVMKFKKILICILAFGIFAGCSNQKSKTDTVIDKIKTEEDINENSEKPPENEDKLENANENAGEGDLDSIENKAISDVENTVEKLKDSNEKIKAKINSYDLYKQNIEVIEEYYASIVEEQKNLGIRLREYSVEYANQILKSDKSKYEKYDDLDGILKGIYEDACDEEEDIYEDITDDLEDAFYSGVINDAQDNVDYGEWSKLGSDEYKNISSLRSELYEDLSDTRSDIYKFYSRLGSEIYGGDDERAEKEVNRFSEKISKMKE